MKNYSTKAYYAYAKKLLEGDATVESKTLDPKFKTLIVGATGSAVGALACLAYMKNMFSIDGWKSLAESIRNYAGAAEGDGIIKSLFVGLGKAISGAISWASNLVAPLTSKIPGLKATIGSSQYTYGSVLSLALIASAVAFVLLKVYKVIKNKRSATLESVTQFNTRQRKELKIAFNECNTMFAKLNSFTEGDAPADTAATEGIIAKAWDGLKGAFKYVWLLAKEHYVIAIMLAIVTACVACWYGIKKYQKSIAEDELA